MQNLHPIPFVNSSNFCTPTSTSSMKAFCSLKRPFPLPFALSFFVYPTSTLSVTKQYCMYPTQKVQFISSPHPFQKCLFEFSVCTFLLSSSTFLFEVLTIGRQSYPNKLTKLSSAGRMVALHMLDRDFSKRPLRAQLLHSVHTTYSFTFVFGNKLPMAPIRLSAHNCCQHSIPRTECKTKLIFKLCDTFNFGIRTVPTFPLLRV